MKMLRMPRPTHLPEHGKVLMIRQMRYTKQEWLKTTEDEPNF